MQKKYQIFVSSTFTDLADERQDTIRSILDLGHIPAGMEIFPAADSEQFEYIKKVIDECDYYILIIGARYGSVDDAGVSFTEREFEYARSRGIPTLVFPHGDVGSIANSRSDYDPQRIERLNAFRTRATTGRLVQFWRARSELKTKVLVSLAKAFDESPGAGWVRAKRSTETIEPSTISSIEKDDESDGRKGIASSVTTSPDSSWTRDNYVLALLRAATSKNEDAVQLLKENYMASSLAKGDGVVIWEANIELARLGTGEGGHLDRLTALAKSNPNVAGVIACLGHAYSRLNENRLAADAYLAAAKVEVDPRDRAKWLRNAATRYAINSTFDQAERAIEQLRSHFTATSEGEMALLQGLLSVAEERRDEPTALALLERMVELKPDDTKLRFKLAHRHSQNSNQDLSLHHYLKISVADREPGTWNNLGVSFAYFSMDARAVDAYRRASDENEVYSMANLGNKFLEAGFVEEAREQCDRALRQGNVPKIVGDLVSAISSVDEDEESKQTGILATAKSKMEFLRSMGKSISVRRVQNFHQTVWRGPDCLLKANVVDELVELSGTFDRNVNALTAGLLGALSAQHSPTIKQNVRYLLTVQGGAMTGMVKRTEEGQSLLSEAATTKTIYMSSHDNGSELSVMEFSDASQPTFYSLKRVED